QHVLTTVGLNELRSQVVTFPEDSVLDRNTFFRHPEQCRAMRTLLTHAFFPAVLRAPVPWPPVFVVTLAVERAFAGDRDVSLFERVDERRVVEEFDTFPTREDDR